MTQLQDRQGFYNPFEKGKNPKYKCCITCKHFGSVFSYRTLSTEMMGGIGERNCIEKFGKTMPSRYVIKGKNE